MTNTPLNHNVSAKEITHFDALAEQWWDLNGPMRTLHHINPCRLNYLTTIAGDLNDSLCLDIGCGGGIFSEGLAGLGAQVTAIDLAPSAIEAARTHAKQQKLAIDYHITSAEQWAQQHSEQYDIVSCLELLEHVPNIQSLIKAAAQLTKPNGLVIFSTINRTIPAYTQLILGAEYIFKLIPRDTHQYRQFIKPSELTKTCSQSGLTPLDIQGMRYNPITRNAKLSTNNSCNYFLAAKKSIKETA